MRITRSNVSGCVRIGSGSSLPFVLCAAVVADPFYGHSILIYL